MKHEKETIEQTKHRTNAQLAHRFRRYGNEVMAKIHNTIAGMYRPSNPEEWAAGYIVEDDIDDDD